MIFSGGLLAKVLDGTKTQTRRPVNFDVHGVEKPPRYVPGGTYSVQGGRGQFGVARIRVLSVLKVPVCVISGEDAIAEGFGSGVEFMERWRSIYGNVAGDCWRIEFELAEGAA